MSTRARLPKLLTKHQIDIYSANVVTCEIAVGVYYFYFHLYSDSRSTMHSLLTQIVFVFVDYYRARALSWIYG